ncbi:MAG: hypothetical protein JJU28_19130 [Cyclobacteriaceae bacterium]|nr:hypothetical protein [Cyclobacteriaceae bacterium]
MNHISNLKILLLATSLHGITLLNAYSQNQVMADSIKVDELSNYYRQFSVGMNNPIYRDFATSPLFYNGLGTQLQMAWLKRSDLRERSFEMGLGLNGMSARIPESKFIQPKSDAFFGQLSAMYLRLWKLKSLSTEKSNIKLGGIVQSNQNFRLNLNLHNNGIGLEHLTNIMASGQITRDISRKEARQLNFWLFKPRLKEVKRDLRFQFNAGILNLNYRPGYTYIYKEEMVGLETQPLSWLLSSYKWSLNGWRFNTQLEYISYLPNGNARSWSYVWDATNAPGRHEKFQMASHQIRFTYYFLTKRR